jgi:lipid-A-disaccharide synthase
MFIGVDYSSFNLGVSKALKSKNIKTIQYICPKVWAWNPNRIAKIKNSVDKVLCLFPFEEDFLKKHNIPASFVGHPLAEDIPLKPATDKARRTLEIRDHHPVITVLPGSRINELKRMAKIFFQGIHQFSQTTTPVEVIVPYINKSAYKLLTAYAEQYLLNVNCHFTDKNHKAIEAADMVLSKMGTSTLEACLYKKPMVAAYKTDWLTYCIVKSKLLIDMYSLPNILSGQQIVPELVQQDLNANNLARALQKLYEDNQKQTSSFDTIHRQLISNKNLPDVLFEAI